MKTSVSHTIYPTAVCSGEHESQPPMVMIFGTGMHLILAMFCMEGHGKQIARKRLSARLWMVQKGNVWNSKEKGEFAKTRKSRDTSTRLACQSKERFSISGT
jgi:hypothetical protein